MTVGAMPGWQAVTVDADARTIRVPVGVELDLGATAKAWCADRAAARAAAAIESGVLVSLGGDVAIAGPAPEDGWDVGVADSHAATADEHQETINLRDGGLATSSTTVRAWARGGERLHHVIDPATGRPADVVWRTVSVAARRCVEANIASTASIIRGERAIEWLASLGLPSRLVRLDGTVVKVSGWPA